MINAIFAADSHGGIGHRGSMPWQGISSDLARFKHITTNSVIVMGRNTWDSPDMPSPLPKRENFVVTRDTTFNHPGATAIDLSDLPYLEKFYPHKRIFIIGGKQLLMAALPLIKRIYYTRIYGEYQSDVKLDLKKIFNGFLIEDSDTTRRCTFYTYIRR